MIRVAAASGIHTTTIAGAIQRANGAVAICLGGPKEGEDSAQA